jgi:hypothetical protein
VSVQLVGSNFSLSTWLLVGASLQAFAHASFTLESHRYILALPIFLLLIRAADGILVTLNIKSNKYYMKDVFLGRRTAMVADPKGVIRGPSAEKIAVFLLGAKSNHPMGFFAPEFLNTFSWLSKINAEFDGMTAPNGCKSIRV